MFGPKDMGFDIPDDSPLPGEKWEKSWQRDPTPEGHEFEPLDVSSPKPPTHTHASPKSKKLSTPVKLGLLAAAGIAAYYYFKKKKG